jgi:predicted double-glycine peptidase
MRLSISFMILMVLMATLAPVPPLAHASNVLVPILQESVFRKQVRTLKERRLSQVVHQTEDFSCGAAALATVLHYYYGKDLTERAAIKEMLKAGNLEKIQSLGFSLLDMQKFTHSLGYQAEGYKISDVNRLKELTVPVIALIETCGGYSHFVVVRKVTEQHVYISDPSWGNRRLSLGAFQQAWNKIILAITGPTLDSAQGLYAGDYPLILPKHDVIRTQGLLGPRVSMDPSFFFIHTSNPAY